MSPKPLRRIFTIKSPDKAVQAFRTVTLPSGKIVQRRLSPAQYFIRTGKPVPGLRARDAKNLGTRFLGRTWYRQATERVAEGKKLQMPLPTFRQRLYGGRLPVAERKMVESQINFAIQTFGKNLRIEQKDLVMREIRRLMPGRMISVSTALREMSRTGLRQLRKQGVELNLFLRGKGFASETEKGTIYSGLMQEHSGRSYLAKGFSTDKETVVTPIHETLHVLQKLGVIKVDVPFAYAAERLYALEKGFLKVSKTRKAPTDFDRTGREQKDSPGTLFEAQWSEKDGNRLGQWVFQNIPSGKRWAYLQERTMGKSHAEAMSKVGLR